MKAVDRARDQGESRHRRLFVGIVLCWLAPNAIFGAFMQTAELRPPFDTVAALDPSFVGYGVLVALLAALAITGRYRHLLQADKAGVDRQQITRSIKSLFASIPLIVTVYVLLGAVLMVVLVSDIRLWSAADLTVAGTLALLVVIQILVPLVIFCLDEFGVAFGHLVTDRPILPGVLRSLPVLLLSLMIGLMQPLYEYARFGEVSLASVVLVGLILPYALAVTLLNLRYGSDALRSVFRFLSVARPEDGVRIEDLKPQALDDFGVLIARTREVVGRLDATRASLEESEQRLRAFAEAASDWFYELDEQLRFVWVSDRLAESTGLSSEALLGHTALEISRDFPSPDWVHLFQTLDAREAFRGFQLAISGDTDAAAAVHLELSAVPLFDEAGIFRGYRGNVSDVSAVVEARRHLRERESQLAQAQKMEAVGQLTGGIAHDFNNLLTAVAGSLELLRMRRPELADERLVREALSASRRAGDLVQRLLAFSRRQSLRPEVVDVGDKLSEMAELLGRTLGVGVELAVSVPDESVRALVDPAQLESAILNLALNARDAMAGTGRLTLEVRSLQVTEPEPEIVAGEYVCVAVEDSGAGIDPAVLPHVFEPFFSTKPDGQGTGLGLSMVYGFVRQSGGGLRVDSRPGQGTRIDLLLPRARMAATVPLTTGTQGAVSVPANTRVLVVEDEPSVMAVVSEALELVGCRVLHAETGAEGIVVLEADTALDVVLSDVVLPGDVSGVDVVRRVRALRPGLPCILMSGYAKEFLNRDADDISDVQVVTKPFRLEQLIRTLTAVLADAEADGTRPRVVSGD